MATRNVVSLEVLSISFLIHNFVVKAYEHIPCETILNVWTPDVTATSERAGAGGGNQRVCNTVLRSLYATLICGAQCSIGLCSGGESSGI